MARLIEDKVKKALSEALLFGKLDGGGRAVVERVGDELEIRCEAS